MTTDEHVQQAEHNEHFAGAINRTAFGDWAIVGVFYAALHYIDAFLGTKGRHPGSHGVRDREIISYHELQPIAKTYLDLKTDSVNARYQNYKPSASEINDAESQDLAAIKQHLRSYVPSIK